MARRTAQQSSHLRRRAGLAAGAAIGMILICDADAASAQEEVAQDDGRLAEIVVTAQRREQRLQDTPISLTVLSADDLARQNVTTVNDVAQFSPNTTVTPGFLANPSDANFYIRGIGQEDPTVTRDPGVGIYLDGVYLGRSQGAALENLDLERIEVLRGPQGTLYGRNTIGGAVNVVTRRPSDRFTGAFNLLAGSRDRLQARGYVSGPIVPGVMSASISMTARQQDGWGYSTVTDQTLGDVDIFSVRGQLLIRPHQDFSILLAADLTNFDGTVAPNVLTGYVPGVTPLGVPRPLPAIIAPQLCTTFCRTTANGLDASVSSRTRGISGRLEWSPGGVTITSITAYRTLRQNNSFDVDGTSFQIYDQLSLVDQDQFSQELNLAGRAFDDRLEFLIGGYYLRENITQSRPITFGSTRDSADPATLSNPIVVLLSQTAPRVTSYAAFAQATLELTDAFSLTGGIRYTDETKRVVYDTFIDNRGGGLALSVIPSLSGLPPILLPSNLPAGRVNYRPITWRISTEWDVARDVMLYGSVAKGFRSGGFNSNASNAAEAAPFNPETSIAYELGVRSELFNRRLRLNAAIFQTDYSDLTFLTFAGTFSIIQNAASGRARGVEIDFSTAEFGGFSLGGSLGYLDAVYTRDGPPLVRPSATNPTPRTLQAGDRLANAPRWSANLGVQQRIGLGSSGDIRVRADLVYKSSYGFWGNALVADPQPGYALLNGRISWSDSAERFTIAAYGTNITGTKYWAFRADQTNSFGIATGVPAPGAEFGIEGMIRF